MNKCLISPWGFVGDHLFASGVAKKLKEEKQFDIVDMACGLRQVEPLLNNNPYIDNVITTVNPSIAPLRGLHLDGWDKQFELNETLKTIPPPLQFQMECGIKNPDTKFEVYTDPKIDEQVKAITKNEPYIACMEVNSWREKAYGFTLKEYLRAQDVPNLGYGGRLRNIQYIVGELSKHIKVVEVGVSPTDRSINISHNLSKGVDNFRSLLWDASLIKGAKYFIGAEGGLANVAAGVRTKTILTGEFLHQLYGYKGVCAQIENPQLGPRFYYPGDGHIDLNPYYTDEEVLEEMLKIINGETTTEDYTYEWTVQEI